MDKTLEEHLHLLRSVDPPQSLQEAVDRLRANLRVTSDLVEVLLTDGPPRRGRSRDDHQAHEQWCNDAWTAMLKAKLAMEQTQVHASSCSRTIDRDESRGSSVDAQLKRQVGSERIDL